MAPPTRLLPSVAPLVNSELRHVGELLATDVAGDDGVRGRQLVRRQLVRVFADDVVVQAAEALPTDGAELPLAAVHGLVASQVGGLVEALPTGGAPVRPHVLVHQLVARKVTGVEEVLSADVADEGLVEVRDAVRLQHTDARVTFPADVALDALFPRVSRLHVQVAMSFVVEPLGTVVAGVRQQPVFSDLMLMELQDAAELRPADQAPRVRLPLVVGESLCVGKQHGAHRALMVSV